MDPVCECVYWVRTDSLNGITVHHPNCEHYGKEPKIWGYEVTNNGEIDYVFAESKTDAVRTSLNSGCHYESDGDLVVRKMTLEEMSEIKIYDNCSDQTTTMLQDFRYNRVRRVCCSTVW